METKRLQTTLIAKSALKYMVSMGIELTPENYKEYFELFTRYPKEKQRDKLQDTNNISPNGEYDIMLDYIEKEKQGLMKQQDILRKEEKAIRKVMESMYSIIEKAVKGTITQQNFLEREKLEIEEIVTIEEIKEIGQRLVQEIDKIAASNENLQYQLEEANKKIKTLEKDLDRIKKESTIDLLTGLHNRRAFEQKIKEELGRFQRYGTPLILMMIDIDGFKQLNDTYGHVVGDAVLQKIGKIFRENIRSSDLVARYGGDEFVLIAPESSVERAKKIALKLKSVLDKTVFKYKNDEFTVTLSIGITQAKPGDKEEDILKRADIALYNAKSAGKNTVAIEV